jgi:hypothetical protein
MIESRFYARSRAFSIDRLEAAKALGEGPRAGLGKEEQHMPIDPA